MKRKFIIKAGSLHAWFLEGTMEELEAFLASVGAKVTGETPAEYQDISYVFRKELHTELEVLGFDTDLVDRACGRVEETLRDCGIELGAGEREGIRSVIVLHLHRSYTRMVKRDAVTVLVSDGEVRHEPNHIYIDRQYQDFGKASVEEFWNLMLCRYGWKRP